MAPWALLLLLPLAPQPEDDASEPASGALAEQAEEPADEPGQAPGPTTAEDPVPEPAEARPDPPAAPAAVEAPPPREERPFVPALSGLDPMLTSIAQLAVAAAFLGLTPSVLWFLTAVLGPVCAPCAVLGGLGTCTFVCMGPAFSVFLQALVGDTLGSQRGAMLWPIALAYGTGCGMLLLQGLVFAVVGAVVGVAALQPLVEGRYTDIEPALRVSFANGEPLVNVAVIIAAILTPLAVAAVPAFAWPTFADGKRPGDRGQLAWPGLLAPRHPPPLPEPEPGMAY